MLGLILFVTLLRFQWIFGGRSVLSIWIIVVGCTIPFAGWQATLLVASIGRRLCWVFASVLAALPFLFENPDWYGYDMFMGAALLQAILLVGVRRRVWAWLAAVLMGFSLPPMTLEASLDLYDKVSTFLQTFIPRVFVMEFTLVRLVVEMSVLGAIAAFLMPPKQEPKQ
jgi:hypothetical protein